MYQSLIRWSRPQIAPFFFRVDMPDDVVRETDDLIACSFRHLGESLCFGLVLEGVTGEIDTLMNVSAQISDAKERSSNT